MLRRVKIKNRTSVSSNVAAVFQFVQLQQTARGTYLNSFQNVSIAGSLMRIHYRGRPGLLHVGSPFTSSLSVDRRVTSKQNFRRFKSFKRKPPPSQLDVGGRALLFAVRRVKAARCGRNEGEGGGADGRVGHHRVFCSTV